MRGDAQDELVGALIARAGGDTRLVAARRRGWASSTFEGERHAVALAMPEAARPAFMRGLAEAEFTLDGHFVASIAIVDEQAGGGRATISLDALTMVAA